MTQKSGFTAAGPYDIENVSIDSYAVYTNRAAGRRAARLRHRRRLAWAYECHTDMIARRARHRSGRVPPQEPAARGPAAGDRHARADAAIDKVLDRIAERMNWAKPFDRGTGRIRRGRGIAIGFKAHHLADHLGGDREHQRRRQLRRSTSAPSTWGRAPTPRWRRSPPRCWISTPSRCASSIRTPMSRPTTWARSARARPSTWAMRCGSRPRTPRRRSRRLRRSSACRRAATCRSPNCSEAQIRHAGRQHHRHRQLHAGLRNARRANRPDARRRRRSGCVGGSRRRGRGRHRDRTRARSPSSSTSPTSARASTRSIVRDATLRRRDHATRLHHCREDGLHATASSPTRSLADYKIPGAARHAARVRSTTRVTAQQSDGPFGAKGVGESTHLRACRRRSPTRSTTRSACA